MKYSKAVCTLPGPGSLLACTSHGRWMGNGEQISFLLTPDKWQVSLRGVLAQAFSLVIINLKMMAYIGVEQNRLVVLHCLLSV